MTLTLTNFEQTIPPTILRRGRDYFDARQVTALEEVDAGLWQAVVQGTDVYQVVIQAGPDGVLNWKCDCPYELGPVCKHVAAVLFALQAHSAAPLAGRADRTPPETRPTRAERVRAALQKLTHAELLNLLVELANRDRELAHLILLRHEAGLDNRQTAASLIREALQLGRPQQGFLDYEGSNRAARTVQQLLVRADQWLAQGQAARALPTYQAIMETVVEALEQADDSSGALGGCVASAVEGIRQVIDQAGPEERTLLFQYLLDEAPQPAYAGWDWRWELAAMAGELVTTPGQRARFFEMLERIAGHAANRWWAEYQQEQVVWLKLAVIERLDGAAAGLPFLQQHTHLLGVRLRLAQRYLEQGDVAAARRESRAGLEQTPPNPAGARTDFLAVLRAAAALAGDRLEEISLAETLFLETGRSQHFQELKNLLGVEAWPAYRGGFLARASEQQVVDMGPLYAAEELWPELLRYVLAQPTTVEQYHRQLAPHYPNELGAVYERLAIEAITVQANRGGYQQACHYLQQMQALGLGAQVAARIRQWREEHKRRRALQEELDRAFGR